MPMTMIPQLSEEFILFIHLCKWLLLATCVGVLVGMTSTGFILLLNLVMDTVARATWSY